MVDKKFQDFLKKEERIKNMQDSDLKKKSKRLSYLLRHDPGDLTIDKNGWVPVQEILDKLNISLSVLKEIVETNDKKRFSFDNTFTKIRANQGHTIDVDLNLKEMEPPTYLFHGTSPLYIDNIKESGGLHKMNRQHVHLSDNVDTAYDVGKRHSKIIEPKILVIESLKMFENGYKFYLSDNNVWLTEEVPNKYIKY